MFFSKFEVNVGFTLSGVGLATPRETNFKHGMKLTLSPDISSNSSMSLKKSITFSRLFFEYEMKSYFLVIKHSLTLFCLHQAKSTRSAQSFQIFQIY